MSEAPQFSPAYDDMYFFGPPRQHGERGSFCHLNSEASDLLVHAQPRENRVEVNRILELRSLQYGCVTQAQEDAFRAELEQQYPRTSDEYINALEGRAQLASGLGHTFLAFPSYRYDERSNTSLTFVQPGESRSFDHMLGTAQATYKNIFDRLHEVKVQVRLAESRTLPDGTIWHPIFDFGVSPHNPRGFSRNAGERVAVWPDADPDAR